MKTLNRLIADRNNIIIEQPNKRTAIKQLLSNNHF